MEILEWVASLAGVFGACLLAINVRHSRYGFLLYFLSSVLWSYVAYQVNMFPLLFNQLVFVAINLVGIQRWVLSNRSPQVWYCDSGCMAYKTDVEPQCSFCNTTMSEDPSRFELALEDKYATEQCMHYEMARLLDRVNGVTTGKHQLWYCPRGCQSHSSIEQPECGACGCPMQTDATSYEFAQQCFEDRGIAAVEADLH